MAPVMSLSDLGLGDHAHIRGVDLPGQPTVRRRIEELGFAPGATIEVVRRAPLGDPTVYRVSDYEICLRRSEAKSILVDTAA